ncbi:MAG: hypothetical protein JSS20_20345, partial [Proteobacteria bacterium]|nr:hypothetical protein [Pseudomonadota bacterium]
VIVVNDAWRMVPNADVLYACDGTWWSVHHGAVRMGFEGELWTLDVKAAPRHGLRLVKHSNNARGLVDADTIGTGSNSGHQAVNLAYLFGAREIVLVGYDFQRTDGKAHYFGEHPSPLSRSHSYNAWQTCMPVLGADLARAGVKVTNCTISTALECFPRADLAETLSTLTPA